MPLPSSAVQLRMCVGTLPTAIPGPYGIRPAPEATNTAHAMARNEVASLLGSGRTHGNRTSVHQALMGGGGAGRGGGGSAMAEWVHGAPQKSHCTTAVTNRFSTGTRCPAKSSVEQCRGRRQASGGVPGGGGCSTHAPWRRGRARVLLKGGGGPGTQKFKSVCTKNNPNQ